MKKMTRATIAGVAGLGLLAGGATFATWSDEETVPGATITAGNMTLTAQENGQWEDVTDSANPVVIDVAQYRAVPGDQLRYTEGFTVGASGDNLSADLSTTGVTEGTAGALEGFVQVNSTFTLDGAALAEVTSDDNGEIVAVEVLVDISEDLGNSGQDGVITLNAGQVNLDQTSPRPPQ